jgi:hypothetical protein
MSFNTLPACLATAFERLASFLHAFSAARLPGLLLGILFAKGRRTVTSWFRAAGVTTDFRNAYNTVWAAGRRAPLLAAANLSAVERCLGPEARVLRLALDDTPTRRWGPDVEGAGLHHNPNRGPAGERCLYGHLWVTLAVLACHPRHGVRALPLLALMYVRRRDVEALPPERRFEFRTKLELAGELLRWLAAWRSGRYGRVELAADGAFAKRPFLAEAKRLAVVVFSRLRRDAALRSLPRPRRAGQRGRPRVYGEDRLSLAMRAGQRRGWREVQCVQYGERVTKTIKTFVATWRPAGGAIRVVIVREDDGWLAFFCTDPSVSAESVLEAMADRGAIEQTFKEVKEVWGAQQQQVRNLEANKGCFNLCLWMHALVEAWAWDKGEEELVDRTACPWDNEPRRASHADKRKALQKWVLREELRDLLRSPCEPEEIDDWADSLLQLAL